MVIWKDRCYNHRHPPFLLLFPELLLLSTEPFDTENPLGQVGSAVLPVSHPNYLSIPSCGSRIRKRERGTCTWHCTSTVQQQPKHRCVINTVLVTNPKHTTVRAAAKNVNSIPDRAGSASNRWVFMNAMQSPASSSLWKETLLEVRTDFTLW